VFQTFFCTDPDPLGLSGIEPKVLRFCFLSCSVTSCSGTRYRLSKFFGLVKHLLRSWPVRPQAVHTPGGGCDGMLTIDAPEKVGNGGEKLSLASDASITGVVVVVVLVVA